MSMSKTKAEKNSKLIDKEISLLKGKYESFSVDGVKKFTDLPLSDKTLKGLDESKFIYPTYIQRESIVPALQGKDVLGAAITGSGKTLAFLVPIVEHLHIHKWSRTDGVCAIVISPTRELAYQTFETLKRFGKYHDFSAGLIIGGKNLKFEKSRMDRCNILICTPGRLLQHMDENPLFNISTMEMLVLDEADRCLDMGFEETLNAIIENLPPNRQTLLFSATQTDSLKDLARLNLNEPVFIRANENDSPDLVPELLQQNFVVVSLENKISMLWSFIKNHLKQKIIVFFSSCKQVKYIMEIFCKLRPGTSLLALYGSLHQDRRIAIYSEFIRKNNVVLFATDIASRGLDFPSVNWVVQMDCPEDIAQYIHRAGRTARNKARGESLLVLMPSEENEMVKELKNHNIILQKIHIDPKKIFSPRAKIEAALAQNFELKASAQRAFLSYIKSVFLMKNKKIFKITEIDFDSFAKSLGLVVTPRVRFLERAQKQKVIKSEVKKEENSKNNLPCFNEKYINSDSEDDLLHIKRSNHDLDDSKLEDGELIFPKKKCLTKAALIKKAMKSRTLLNRKCNFDEDGEVIVEKPDQSIQTKEYVNDSNNGGINIDVSKRILKEEDAFDKERFRELIKNKHRNVKKKRKNLEQGSFSSDSDDIESDASVDLSWLPNPDKLYSSDNSKYAHGDANNKEDDKKSQPTKKRIKITSELSVNDAETIAVKLLANSK